MIANTYPIKMRDRGQLTIPQPVREQWTAESGDMMTLVQFDDFVLLTPNTLKTPSLAKQFSQLMEDEGVSLADLLEGLAEERENSYQMAQSRES
jgi:bifunctional DNA-binding transcriptional regulator/antitoxin component of YhaV-PrlF toxin-antitoxin module